MRPTTTPTTTQVPRVQRGWCRRSFVVSIEAEPFVVDYSPWGMNTETVSVDGVTVVRRRGGHTMSHAFHFPLGDHRAILSIALPWWGELFIPLWLSFVQIEIDGQVVYREGRPPKRPLRRTVANLGFPVVRCNGNFPTRSSPASAAVASAGARRNAVPAAPSTDADRPATRASLP